MMESTVARAVLSSLPHDALECTPYKILRCLAVAVMIAAVATPSVSAQRGRSEREPDPATMNENDLVAMVPTQGPDTTCACPACAKYCKWSWDAAKPNEIACPECKTVYPNAEYPADRTQVFLNFIGEEVSMKYHQGKTPSGGFSRPNPDRYFLSSPIDNAKYQWCKKALTTLANEYASTGNDDHARRAALLLNEFARNYEHYLVHRGRGRGYYVSTGGPCMVDGKLKGVVGEDLPYDWIDCRLVKCWIGELDLSFVRAYAAITESPALDKLSAELGMDVRERIRRDFLRAMCDFMLLVPWKHQMANNLPPFAKIAEAGRVIGEPEYVHVAYRYLTEIIEGYGRERGVAGYTFDLHNPEGNQCHYGMRRAFETIFESIKGWSDPPDYKGKLDGVHLKNVSLEKDFPLVWASRLVPDLYRLPNGMLSPIHDTIGYAGQGGDLGPLEASRNRLLPGFGQAVLGDGQGEKQVQVQLHYSTDNANHCHRDCLSLVWYAHGREMSGDIGYQRNSLRHWASCTLSHNTVVVNRSNQNGTDGFGNLLLYEPNLPGLSVISVEGRKGYSQFNMKRHRRTVILNTMDIDAPYFVDVFEVEGGQSHDYAMHGSVLGDMAADSSLPMTPSTHDRILLEPGQVWKAPEGMGPFDEYGLFIKGRSAPVSQGFWIDFTYPEAPDVGTRIHMLRDAQTEVVLARTPALRKAGHYKESRIYDWWMPHLVARRTGENGLKSVFVAVYDMYRDGPKIKSVKRLNADADSVALEIDMGDRVDTMLLLLDGPATIYAGGVTITGKLGMVSRAGNLVTARLVGGTSLRSGSLSLESRRAVYTGKIVAATRKYDGAGADTFTVEADLPAGKTLRGSWMVVQHPGADVTHGYEIDRVETVHGRTVVYLKADHGLRIKGTTTREVFSQWRTFTGENTFTITTSHSKSGYLDKALPAKAHNR